MLKWICAFKHADRKTQWFWIVAILSAIFVIVTLIYPYIHVIINQTRI